jgi:ubiquinone/menaquinone biosynthesis C-methylase UbiE
MEYLMEADRVSGSHVPETRFGIWFLNTEIWFEHVLCRAVTDLDRLIQDRRRSYPVVVDVGCGWGRSFKLLRDHFHPHRMIGIDIDPAMIEAASKEARSNNIEVELFQTSNTNLMLEDQSVDIIFCHQTFHHLVNQEAALSEFYRVLKPNGILLFAESTRKYINSWIIRLLFRHPMNVQRTAAQYIEMINKTGFATDSESISYPYLWWSRGDLGILERWFGIKPSARREETLINLVAVRPSVGHRTEVSFRPDLPIAFPCGSTRAP